MNCFLRVILQKFVYICIAFASSISIVSAQKVNFTVEAPTVVEVGEVFRVVYRVNASPEKGFEVFPVKGLELVSGPQRGQSSSMSIVNGRTTMEYELSETYHYRAENPGSVTIQPATVHVDGRPYKTRAHKIDVVGSSAAKQQALQNSTQNQTTNEPNVSQNLVASDDVFVQVSVNKSTAYVGEAIYVSLKLYTKHRLTLNDHSYPEFSGFYKQDIEAPQSLQYEREVIQDQEYSSVLFKKMVVYPQRAGDIVISPFEVDCNIMIPVSRGFWGLQYDQQRKIVASKPVTIKVNPLPSGKPSNFEGAVGEFTVKAETDVQEISQNDAFSYRVTISGTGNLSLLQEPSIAFSSDFEVYDPKVTRKVSPTAYGDKGSVTYEYVIIPRHEGNYTIPLFQFSYFNVKDKAYATATAPEIPIEVTRAKNSSGSAVSNFSNQKEEVRYVGNDIRYIKTKDFRLDRSNQSIFGTIWYALWFIIPSVFVLLFVIIRRKQIQQNQDIARVRTRRANKESRKRLKQARVCLQNGEDARYYDEIAKALWGYIADKYTIPLAELKKDTVIDFLQEKNVPETHISELITIIEQCEIARYTPNPHIKEKEKLYTRASECIQVFEQIVK